MALFAQSARQAGHQVIAIPDLWDDPQQAADVFCSIPVTEHNRIVVLGGYIGTRDYYQLLADGVDASGRQLLQSPSARAACTYADNWYPKIAQWTARSAIIRTADDIDLFEQTIGYPAFVKGAVKSTKEAGWEACIVKDRFALERQLASMQQRPATGQFLFAREIRPYRQDGRYICGFPISREYRLYLLGSNLLGYGCYWEDTDIWGPLTDSDRAAFADLAAVSAQHIAANTVALDVAQLADGSWEIVEVGDWQYSGISHMHRDSFWEQLHLALQEQRLLEALLG